jgi:hypothetical protein
VRSMRDSHSLASEHDEVRCAKPPRRADQAAIRASAQADCWSLFARGQRVPMTALTTPNVISPKMGRLFTDSRPYLSASPHPTT